MIEDKELGLKVAENEEEEIWDNVKKSTERGIKSMEKELIVNREVLRLCGEMQEKMKEKAEKELEKELDEEG